MAKREKIKSKESVAKKLFWVSLVFMLVLTFVLMWLKFDDGLSLKENTGMFVEVFLTYFAGPLFIGITLFSLSMMKEIDDKKWENQDNE